MKHSHVLCVLSAMCDYLPYTVHVTFPQVETQYCSNLVAPHYFINGQMLRHSITATFVRRNIKKIIAALSHCTHISEITVSDIT